MRSLRLLMFFASIGAALSSLVLCVSLLGNLPTNTVLRLVVFFVGVIATCVFAAWLIVRFHILDVILVYLEGNQSAYGGLFSVIDHCYEVGDRERAAKRAKRTQRRLAEQNWKLDKERKEYERRYAQELRKAKDPEEIKRRERAEKLTAIEAQFAANKPVPPPAKSKRLTEADRVERETSWSSQAIVPALIFWAVASFFAKPLLEAMGATFIVLVVIILLVIVLGARAYHLSDAHQRYLKAQARDEDRKWAEEDAAWHEYELNLAAWEKEKRQRLLALDALQTDIDGVTNIGRTIIDELNL